MTIKSRYCNRQTLLSSYSNHQTLLLISGMDTEDISTLYTSLLIVILAICEVDGIFLEPQLLRTDRRRGMVVTQQLMTGATQQFYYFARMERPIFLDLIESLQINYGLKGSSFISPAEKGLIFLHIVSEGISIERTSFLFQHAKSTIHRYETEKVPFLNRKFQAEIYYILIINSVFHEVLSALRLLYNDETKLPTGQEPTPNHLQDNSSLWPYFKDCIGALDGSHLPVNIPENEQAAWRNRKQVITQNILGVCDFNLVFVHILAGWEGSAHDGKVFSAAREQGFKAPPGKYFLADAAYSNSAMTMAPYRAVRYHLKEWAKGDQRPRNAKELFNLRHATLRNHIERAFGVLKRKFRILKNGSEYSIQVQIGMVYGLVALYNFIRRRASEAEWQRYVESDLDEGEDEAQPDLAGDESLENNATTPENAEMAAARDELANWMWNDYY